MDDGIIQNVHWRRTKHKISHKKHNYILQRPAILWKRFENLMTKQKKKEWYMTEWLSCEATVPKKNKNKNKQTKAKNK